MNPPENADRSFVLRRSAEGWEGVTGTPYKEAGAHFRNVARHSLASPPSAGFDVRYFELGPSGYTTLEKHEHVHVVVCLRGCGRLRIGGSVLELWPEDVAYIAPGEPHQLVNPMEDAFGFLCIVDRERDRPVPLEDGRA